MSEMFYEVSIGEAKTQLQITNVRPEGGPIPDTFAQLTWIPEKGFEVTMWSFEDQPRAVYFEPNDPVCTDSCMECFLNVFPEMDDKGYMSIEMNPNGASHSSFGVDRHHRDYLLNLGQPHPEVTVTTGEDNGRFYWKATSLFRRDVLEALYGRPCDFGPGHKMRANFYKCADDKVVDGKPACHWGSWSAVSKLDFHMPQHFGYLEIK